MRADAQRELTDFTLNLKTCPLTTTEKRFRGEKLISDFSVPIPGKRHHRLVGPSGGGKSTVSKSSPVLGLTKGAVTIGGVDVRPWTRSTDELYAFVFQRNLSTTRLHQYQNGIMGRSREDILEAAKPLLRRIRAFAAGRVRNIARRKRSTLSGGARSAISIARALLKNAPVVLLDVATASLDRKTRCSSSRPFPAHQRQDVIVIALRRHVAGADKIIVIDKGRAVEQGTHDEL
jgi:ATP-binding cassette subfamily B protein